jgi:hypothetical protein
MTFYAYPVEWWALALGVLMVVVHAVECWDVMMRYSAFRRSHWRKYRFLHILAMSGNRTAVLRLIQALAILQQGTRGVLTSPPPLIQIANHTTEHADMILASVYSNRISVIIIAVASITKGIWAMYDRHRAVAEWNRAGRPEISPE